MGMRMHRDLALALASVDRQPQSAAEAKKARRLFLDRAVPITRYACPDCDDEYHDQEMAAECCWKGADGTEVDSRACPVCNTEHEDEFDAISCCLWFSFSVEQRFQIAALLKQDRPWADALRAVTAS